MAVREGEGENIFKKVGDFFSSPFGKKKDNRSPDDIYYVNGVPYRNGSPLTATGTGFSITDVEGFLRSGGNLAKEPSRLARPQESSKTVLWNDANSLFYRNTTNPEGFKNIGQLLGAAASSGTYLLSGEAVPMIEDAFRAFQVRQREVLDYKAAPGRGQTLLAR
jgi:hypothetical protein